MSVSPAISQQPMTYGASTAEGADGQELASRWNEYNESRQGSWTLFETKRELFQELRQIALESSEDDWDGCEASAVSERAIQNAAGFILAFPTDLCKPELGVSPRGDISFDWAQSAGRSASRF